jgi:hypothetical protein
MLVTAVSLNDKAYKYTQNMGQIKFDNLSLITTLEPEYNYSKKSKRELEEYKLSCLEGKLWDVNLLPNEKFTWVLSTSLDYDPANFRNWGFR